ncbi:MAG: glycoside hydrolase TIM-barrel-like domain-containing protein, partial [Acidobacteriota bacterium]
ASRATPPPLPPSEGAAVDGKRRGVNFVAGSEITAADFQPLLADHVNWIVQTPFGWQTSARSTEVRFSGNGGYWGERDQGIESTTLLARRYGIHTLLKPHLWIRGGVWSGEIAMRSDSEWKSWFSSYDDFILHYAQLAQRLGIEELSIGTELGGTTITRGQDWRKIIASVRAVYSGKLTYSANWGEFEQVTFWNDLDSISIQAYFPLTKKNHPTVDELLTGWNAYLRAIEAVQARYGKPVQFTEIGYRSAPDAAIEPWQWPKRLDLSSDPETQARCYEAFFRVFWKRPWFAGAYFWKWFPH